MKKKITMLFAALLACVGVSAQAYDGVYTIGVDENIQRGYVAAGVDYTEYPVLSGITLNGYTQNDTESIENGKNWYITSVDEGTTYYIYNVALGKFLVGGDVINFGDTPYTWSFSDNSGYVNIKDVTVGKFLSGGCGRTAANRPIAYDTNSNDGGAKHTITAVDGGETTFATQIAAADAAIQALVNSVVDMVYVYKYGETEWGRETIEAKKGEAYPAPAARYGVTYTLPEGNVAVDAVDGTEVEINCSLSGELPFQFATDYNSIEHWYYLNIRDSDPTYMYYDSSVEYIKATESSVPDESKDVYTWAFVGNPFAGFSIVNYAAGETMVLSAPTAPTGDKNAAELARMVAKDVATGNLVWTILKPTHTDRNPAPVEGSFYVQHPTATTYAFNRQSYNSINTVCYWSQRDTGSDLQVVERPMGAAAELAALLEEVEAMGVVGGENVGDYTVASVTALNEAVAAAKAVETATDEDVAVLQAAIDGLAINLPEVGKFYAIKSASTNGYCSGKYVHSIPSPITRVDATWGPRAYDHRHLVYDEMVSVDATALWQFTEDMKMRNVHTGEYVKSFNKNVEHMGAEATASSITIKPLGSSQVSLQIGSNNPMHAQEAYFTIVDWTAELNNASAWYIEEVTEFAHPLTIDEYDYMTLTLGFNAEVPEGVTAYKVTGTEGKELTLESVGTVIPAGEPVIVYAEVAEGQTKDVEFAYTAEEATKSGDNLLKGTLVDNSAVAPTTGYDAYVMALNGTEVVMGKAILTEGQFKNRANKAYLELQQEVAAGAAMFSFGRGEGTTGIETAVNGEQTAVIYDLAGRRVEKMEKGIYIVNGKKVIR